MPAPALASCGFAAALKNWRAKRKLSQLELSLRAGVSQKHLSWLETGRSQPSREMVIRLGDAMSLPLRERNVLLQAGGFAAAYQERPLEAPEMEAVLDALRQVLEHQQPFPALVVDRFWNVRMRNRATELFLTLHGDAESTWRAVEDDGRHNLARLTLHPKGLRPWIANWSQAAPSFLRRLQQEALESGDGEMHRHYEEMLALAGPQVEGEIAGSTLMPVLPLEIAIGDTRLSLFSVITTFGTPQDITTDELRVEAFYPNDAVTRNFFSDAAGN